MQPGAFIYGEWHQGQGTEFGHDSPIDGKGTWRGQSAGENQIASAVRAARSAFPEWSQQSLGEKENILKCFADRVQATRLDLAALLVAATGKPNWEALQEVDLIAAKVKNSIQAHHERLAEKTIPFEGYQGKVRYKPIGVAAVLGPFNLPAHLPHSHIVPALLAGNTLVFKPSEFAPSVGAFLMDCWHQAGLPKGVLNLVQGGRVVGETLSRQGELDALYFTGSYRAGLALNRIFADSPGKMLALELGGNNPLVVWGEADPDLAANLMVQSAFLTAGQRCVCARRLILPTGPVGDLLCNRFIAWSRALQFGLPHESPEPFYGTVIHAAAAQECLNRQAQCLQLGGKALLPMQVSEKSPCLLSPGIVDVTGVHGLPDEEVFGPLVQVLRVPDFKTALDVANRTAYGLSAGLISASAELWQTFQTHIRAGVVNWNRQTTGASGALPFGGIGKSGNHRPSAWTAADYCAYPMASLESQHLTATVLPPGLVRPA